MGREKRRVAAKRGEVSMNDQNVPRLITSSIVILILCFAVLAYYTLRNMNLDQIVMTLALFGLGYGIISLILERRRLV